MKGGLTGFIEEMGSKVDPDVESWAEGGSKWLDEVFEELTKDWHPLYCIYKGQHLRRKDKDSPWEEYEPEDSE